jgi:class 3 adenylate cyclase
MIESEMGDVERWLQTLGLERYSRVFSQHAIDGSALRELTERDLRQLGIPVEHRRRMLKALRLLAANNRLPSGALGADEGDHASPELPRVPASARQAERRHLTILFVDMVDSTALAQRLDPEDLADLTNAFHQACSRVVRRYGGYVAKHLGDALVAYFGWPESHENDAERAVLAGLALISAVKEIPADAAERIQIHVGIATGEVVIGDVLGRDSAQVHEAFGEIPSLAARLQAISLPDTVLISEETHRLVEHKFACLDTGRKKLKGFHESTQVYRVISARALPLDFDARTATGLTPLVGRNAELNLLKSRWARAAAGDGHVVLLAGDPGIGKSRLCAELRLSVDGQNLASFSFQCSPLHADSPLHPVSRCIAQIAGLSDDDSVETKRKKLDSMFDDVAGDRRDALSLLATHLGITESGYGPALTGAQRQRMALHRLLADFFGGIARRRPVLITFEDVHWMDPTTSEFLELLLRRINARPILVVVTFRPTFSFTGQARKRQTSLTLTRLTRDESALLVEKIAQGADLPPQAVAEIIDRSDGVPLYLEELTSAVLGAKRSRLARPSQRARFASGPTDIPATLRESLLARIDQVSARAKELIQLCAVMGRRFSYEQIMLVAGMPKGELDETLAELTKTGLLHSSGLFADAEYFFRHALIQDAAYSMILREKRQRFHARCARAFEEHFPSMCTRDPAILARHCEAAGKKQAAVSYFFLAGELACDRFALQEANTYLQRALVLLETSPDADWRNKQELKVRSMLGRVCIFSKGWAHASVKKEYERALSLSRGLGTDRDEVPLQWALATYHLLRGNISEAVRGGQRVLELAEQADDRDLLSVAHSALTIYRFYNGDFCSAVRHKDAALRFYRMQSSEAQQKHFGTDRRLQALRGAALAHWCLGNHQTAIDLDNEQRSLALDNGRPFEYAYALTISCILHSLRRDADTTYSFAEAAIEIAQEQGFNFLEANARNFRAIGLALRDPADATLRHCDEALEKYEAAGNRMGLSAMLAIMGELCLRSGDRERGLLYVDRGLEYVRRSGERFAQSDLYRVKGEILADQPADAKRCLTQALRIARSQQAATWELAAATPLTELLAAQSDVEPAYALSQALLIKLQSSPHTQEQLARLRQLISRLSPPGRNGSNPDRAGAAADTLAVQPSGAIADSATSSKVQV